MSTVSIRSCSWKIIRLQNSCKHSILSFLLPAACFQYSIILACLTAFLVLVEGYKVLCVESDSYKLQSVPCSENGKADFVVMPFESRLIERQFPMLFLGVWGLFLVQDVLLVSLIICPSFLVFLPSLLAK